MALPLVYMRCKELGGLGSTVLSETRRMDNAIDLYGVFDGKSGFLYVQDYGMV